MSVSVSVTADIFHPGYTTSIALLYHSHDREYQPINPTINCYYFLKAFLETRAIGIASQECCFQSTKYS